MDWEGYWVEMGKEQGGKTVSPSLKTAPSPQQA